LTFYKFIYFSSKAAEIIILLGDDDKEFTTFNVAKIIEDGTLETTYTASKD